MLTLYKNIKERRLALKMSQDALAELTGYKDRSSIAKIEKGEVDISESKIREFAKALKISPNELMGWDDGDTISDDDDDCFYLYKHDELLDDYVHEVGEFLYSNPNHKRLIDASMRIQPEDVTLAKEMLDRISGYSSNLQAAHNDYEDDPEEQEKMKSDMNTLKRPE